MGALDEGPLVACSRHTIWAGVSGWPSLTGEGFQTSRGSIASAVNIGWLPPRVFGVGVPCGPSQGLPWVLSFPVLKGLSQEAACSGHCFFLKDVSDILTGKGSLPNQW